MTEIGGAQALRSSPVSMTFGALIDMATDPQFQIACRSFQSLFAKEGGDLAK